MFHLPQADERKRTTTWYITHRCNLLHRDIKDSTRDTALPGPPLRTSGLVLRPHSLLLVERLPRSLAAWLECWQLAISLRLRPLRPHFFPAACVSRVIRAGAIRMRCGLERSFLLLAVGLLRTLCLSHMRYLRQQVVDPLDNSHILPTWSLLDCMCSCRSATFSKIIFNNHFSISCVASQTLLLNV